MELLLFLALLISVIAWIGRVGSKARRIDRQFRRHVLPKKLPPKFRPAPPRRRQEPAKRFTADTARPVPENTEIVGPAWVTDGDTITINKLQVRLFGIDAPELNHPFGQKAKWAMVKLCKGQTVKAEIVADDHFGRTVAKCLLEDGRDLSAELVKQGLAIDWPTFSGGVYSALEVPGARKKLWLADARQKGRMHVWERFDYDAYRVKTGRRS